MLIEFLEPFYENNDPSKIREIPFGVGSRP